MTVLNHCREATPSKEPVRPESKNSNQQLTTNDAKSAAAVLSAHQSKLPTESYTSNSKELKRVYSQNEDSNDSSSSEKRLKIDDESE